MNLALVLFFLVLHGACWFVFGWTMAQRRTLRRAIGLSLANPALSARSLIVLIASTEPPRKRP